MHEYIIAVCALEKSIAFGGVKTISLSLFLSLLQIS